ncbi:hypothetical protein [Methylobacterium gossipiicola]|uniref:Uncharacterized protein n=1 Tax=Methylobacterium gossipiicola TaxID=582675 RepID=A0A1I2X6D1_9HYPH|nr:hypothetical protein [Methylobacterium gossipiicola]SFH08246.1 hypothetical protein SAMN05192565_13220 [Methylobacterium gossipiicola]
MSDRATRPGLLTALFLLLASAPAFAEPGITILDLPFAASALRAPGSEVAVAVATSGLLPLARPKTDSPKADPTKIGPREAPAREGAPIAVVWGEAGGAALTLAEGGVRVTLLGHEAVEGLAAAETPRGALPGSARAVSGGLSAHLAEPVAVRGRPEPGAARLVIRERKPVPMSAEPKAVPVATATVSPAPDAAFAVRSPVVTVFDGHPALVVVTENEAGSALGVVAPAEAGWSLRARGAPEPGRPLQVAGIADFSGTGRPQIAVTGPGEGAPRLRLWSYADGTLTPGAAAPGYDAAAPGEGGPGLAALLPRDGAVDLALPVADRSALAILSLKGTITERARVPLPAPAAFGVAALGTGREARLLVGLADGRIAVVNPNP